MRIFCREFAGESDSTFSVDLSSSTIKLATPDAEYTLEIPTAGYWVYYFDQSNNIIRLDATEMVLSRDTPSYLSKLFVADVAKSLIAVSFDDLVVLRAKVAGENLETFSSNEYKFNLQLFAAHKAEAAEIYRKFLARQQYTFSIDNQASLSSLEKQVDYLTSLLATLIPGDSTLPSYVAQSSLNDPQAIAKSLEFKAKLRGIQRLYDESK